MSPLEKSYNFIKNPLVIGVFILFVVFVYQVIDRPLAIYLHQLNIREHLPFLKYFTALGTWLIYVAIFFGAGIYLRYVKKSEAEKKAWYLLGCIFIPNVIGLVLKVCLGRARPDLLFSSQQFGFYGFEVNQLYWSMPSGHSVTIAALAYGLGIVFPKYFYAFLTVALLVATSRVLLYHHYLSDVLASFYYSLLIAGIFSHTLKRFYKY